MAKTSDIPLCHLQWDIERQNSHRCRCSYTNQALYIFWNQGIYNVPNFLVGSSHGGGPNQGKLHRCFCLLPVQLKTYFHNISKLSNEFEMTNSVIFHILPNLCRNYIPKKKYSVVFLSRTKVNNIFKITKVNKHIYFQKFLNSAYNSYQLLPICIPIFHYLIIYNLQIMQRSIIAYYV